MDQTHKEENSIRILDEILKNDEAVVVNGRTYLVTYFSNKGHLLGSVHDDDKEELRKIIKQLEDKKSISKPTKTKTIVANSSDIGTQALSIFSEKYGNMFKLRNTGPQFINLERLGPAICPISGETHERDNAYLLVLDKKNTYQIHFGCSRGCLNRNGHKLIRIGSIKK